MRAIFVSNFYRVCDKQTFPLFILAGLRIITIKFKIEHKHTHTVSSHFADTSTSADAKEEGKSENERGTVKKTNFSIGKSAFLFVIHVVCYYSDQNQLFNAICSSQNMSTICMLHKYYQHTYIFFWYKLTVDKMFILFYVRVSLPHEINNNIDDDGKNVSLVLILKLLITACVSL